MEGYSRFIPDISDNFNNSIYSAQRSICSIIAIISNGKYSMPIDSLLWEAENLTRFLNLEITQKAANIFARIQINKYSYHNKYSPKNR